MENISKKDLIKHIKANSPVCPQINEQPNEESIIKILEYIIEIEIASGRFPDKTKVIKNYTWLNCYDIAQAIYSLYQNSNKLKIVYISAAIPSLYGKLPTNHYVVEFGGFFYDILGKHTKQDVEAFCKTEFAFNGIKFKTESNEDFEKYKRPTQQGYHNPIIAYCVNQLIKNNVSEPKENPIRELT